MKETMTKILDVMKKLGEKAKEIFEKVKVFLGKTKEELKKIDIFNKIVAFAKANRFVLSIVCFCIVILALVLIATLGWGEFVVPVCVLMILEVSMAVLLHRTELWIHGILLGLHLVAGILIARVPLTILCMVAYVAATLTQQVAFKKKVTEQAQAVEVSKSEEPKSETSSSKKAAKANVNKKKNNK